ncbi:hypothetical protein G647_10423 [Cladophialophora carrionii CBS 160.54]|uniref:Uncharacterized protein n=1 Tax=Cladophialophora carrionii CBS 160.54 TaxID=1279043 RepID=V9DI74_9EURO|nr:uncharacterized protein G647_10423 [Cladophialophora carrionii CBS 160.54]ETI26609.1 hypothetical protein G647_10423 [Cladophialophora carrionii CBS 160.54]
MPRNVNTAPLARLDGNRFHTMEADVEFYREDDDGNIRPQNAWVSVGADRYNNHLGSGARVALALTEVCCKNGLGKVFVFNLHPRPANNIQAHKALKAVPELFYLPYVWAEGERAKWERLKP